MISIISAHEAPHHLTQFRAWCVQEWGHLDRPDQPLEEPGLPTPLLAVSGEKLLGGIAFIHHPIPRGTKKGLWIDALFVPPSSRLQGIGTQLVNAAENEATRLSEKWLFAYTAIPAIYQKAGWAVVSVSGNDVVLKRILKG